MPPDRPPHRAPTASRADAWLIPTLAAAPSGAFVGAHSLVIRGAEPVVVDTGCCARPRRVARQVFSVVEPEDVRWIFLSHDDHDHVGNLDVVLERCPNATLVANFGIVAPPRRRRRLPARAHALARRRATSLDVGDRTLRVVRPPLFDSPTTRGLYDPTDRLLWAVDSFGALFPGAVYEAADVPATCTTAASRC